jgi:PKD repeat protein
MKNSLFASFLMIPFLSFTQTCNKLNHNCSNTSGLNTSGVTSNGGSTYACALGNNVLYSSSSNSYIATDDISIAEGAAATLHFESRKASGYSGTCEVWVHVGGYCNFSLLSSPFDENGWVQIGTFSPTTTCNTFGPFTVPSDVIGGQNISFCIVPDNASSTNWVSIDDICVSEISGSAVATTMDEDFGTSSSGWYPNSGVDDIPYHSYKNASSAYTLLSFGADGGSDKAAYFYTGFDFCSSVSGVGIITKEINTSGYTNGELRLEFKSKYPCSGTNSYTFDEDYTNYSPEVFVMQGADQGSNTWTALPVNYYFSDYNWRVASYDISAYNNANVRFKIERGGFCATAMEAVDNIKVFDRDCSISLLSCGTISGNATPLQSTDYVYTVPAVVGATYYKWYVRDGGTLYDASPYIVGGQGTQSATINFNTLPTSGVRVLCIPFDSDPLSEPDACYAKIGYLGVTVSASIPLEFSSVDSTHVTCAGDNNGTITLGITGGQPIYAYDWLPNVSSTNSATGLAAGTYQITVTDQNLDQIVESIVITEPNTLVVTAPLDIDLCEGSDTLLDATVNGGTLPYIYAWTPATNIDNAAIEDPTVNPPANETYVLTVTDANGCAANDDVVITILAVPLVSFVGSSLFGCEPMTVNFSNTSFPSGVSCIWDFDDGNFSNTCGSTSNVFVAGDFDVSLTVTDANGCTSTTTYNSYIDVLPDAIADFTLGSYCANDMDPLPTFINGGTAGDFSSTAGLVIDSGTGLVDLDASTPGTYTVTNVSDLGLCTSSYDDDIIIFEIPDAAISGGGNVCSNEPLPDVTIDVSSGSSSWDITYDFDGSPVVENSATNQFVISNAAIGTYDLVSITDGNSCVNSITGQVVVDVTTAPTANLGPDLSTCDEMGTLDAGAGMDSYLWSTSETTQTIDVAVNGDYWVVVTLNGCEDSDTINFTSIDCSGVLEFNGQKVMVYPNPTADFVIIENIPLDAKLSLFDLNGNFIKEISSSSSKVQIDLSDLSSGLYTVVIATGEISKSVNVSKQ